MITISNWLQNLLTYAIYLTNEPTNLNHMQRSLLIVRILTKQNSVCGIITKQNRLCGIITKQHRLCGIITKQIRLCWIIAKNPIVWEKWNSNVNDQTTLESAYINVQIYANTNHVICLRVEGQFFNLYWYSE